MNRITIQRMKELFREQDHYGRYGGAGRIQPCNHAIFSMAKGMEVGEHYDSDDDYNTQVANNLRFIAGEFRQLADEVRKTTLLDHYENQGRDGADNAWLLIVKLCQDHVTFCEVNKAYSASIAYAVQMGRRRPDVAAYHLNISANLEEMAADYAALAQLVETPMVEA